VVPLSIVVLQSLQSSPRADAILERLQARLAPAQRQTFRDSGAARLPCNLLPEEARADIEQRLDRIDSHWRDCIAVSAPAATSPGRFPRPRAPQPRQAGR
jgi:hypothetical protein